MYGATRFSQQPGSKIQFVAQVFTSLADFARWIAGDDRIGFDIFDHDGTRANHGSVANGYSRKNNSAIGNPDPVANNDIAAAVGKVRGLRVVTECQNGRFRPNGNVVAGPDMKFADRNCPDTF